MATATDEKKIESKVIEEVKAIIVEPETVASANTSGEEGTKAVELTMEPILPPKSDEEEVGVKQKEVKKVVDDGLPVEVKDVVEKKSIPDSIAPSVQEQVAEPALESTETKEEQHDQPKAADDDVPRSYDEVVEKPRDQSDVLPTKDEESIEKKDSEDSAPSKEVDGESVSVAPEIEVKTEDQSEVNEQVAKPELDEATEKQDEKTEVLPVKSEAVAVEHIQDSGAVAKEVEKREPVVPVKEQSEGTEKVEKQEEQSPEGTEKTQESSVVHPIEESEAVPVKDTDASEILSREAYEPKPVVPEVDVKPEEPSEVIKQIEEPEAAAPEGQVKIEEQAKQVDTETEDEKTESVATEVPVKLEEQAELTEQVDDEKKDATPDAVSPEVQVKPEGKPELATPIEAETEDPKSVSVDPEVAKQIEAEPTNAKPESIEPEVELKPDDHTEVEQSTESENVKDEKKISEILSSEGESSLPDVAENVSIEDKKWETDVHDTVEVSSKELVVETGKAGVEKEGSTITNEGENEKKDASNEELAQPKIVGEATNAVSNAEVTEAVAENIKEETAALIEPKKNGDIEGKLDEATTTTANDLVKESRDSGPEAKEPESEQPNEDKLVKGKVEVGDDPKITEVVSKEVAAKKQSNNILSKVKQSLVKAKKAIVGKSPGPKTPSSDTIK